MSEKRYHNCGTSPLVIEGSSIQPGDAFTANLTEEHEAFLVSISAIVEDDNAPVGTVGVEPEARDEPDLDDPPVEREETE